MSATEEPAGPLELIQQRFEEAKAGRLTSPSRLIARARAAARDDDAAGFLEALQLLLGRSPIELEPLDFQFLARDALQLDLPDVRGAIFAIATERYPDNKELLRRRLGFLAHSGAAEDREKAREMGAEVLGLTRDSEGHLLVAASFDTDDRFVLGLVLDAMHADGLHEDALELTSAVVPSHGHLTTVARNHARALDRTGDKEGAQEWFRRAVEAADRDDTSWLWYGNKLASAGRYRDALRAYIEACRMDLDDAKNFLSISAVLIVGKDQSPDQVRQPLPAGIPQDLWRRAVTAAASAPHKRSQDRSYIANLAETGESIFDAEKRDPDETRRERAELLDELSALVAEGGAG